MWNIKWLGAHVHILQKTLKLGPFDLHEWLITNNNPFSKIVLENLSIEFLFLTLLWALYNCRIFNTLTAFSCACLANMDSKFADTFSTLLRYTLAASGSKTFWPDAIASSSLVEGLVQYLRMRYSPCIVGKCVLRWLMRPKSDVWELMCMKVKWGCSPFKLYFIAWVTVMILQLPW